MRSSGLIVFTVANVPTGINIGVSNEPWGVWTIPRRAPVCLHVLINSYVIGMHLFIPSLIRCFLPRLNEYIPSIQSIGVMNVFHLARLMNVISLFIAISLQYRSGIAVLW